MEAGIAQGTPPTSEQVAFRVAPRLNAAGRVDTAELALAVFEERDPGRAADIARELSERNARRQSIESRVTKEARARILAEMNPQADRVLVLADEGWHRGVLGIAASRLAREYHRPVLLFALEGGRAVGSGRSIPGVALHDILLEIRDLFDEFGGHDQAVGGSLPRNRILDLKEAARALFARRVPDEILERRQEAELGLSFGQLDEPLLESLARLEPHGMANPRPVFHAAAVRPAGPIRQLGESGVRGRLESDGRALDFVCWSGALDPLWASGRPLDVHYCVRRGWRGQAEAEVIAARPASA